MIAVYGSVNWDEIYQLERYPSEHEKVYGTGLVAAVGGAAANTSTWLAAAGVPVGVIGAVGDDAAGRLCLDALGSAGVGVSFVEVLPGVATGRASSWVSGSDKRIVRYREAGLTRSAERSVTLDFVRECRHLHVASHLDEAGMECVAAAVSAGLTLSVELSGHRHDELRSLADVVFLNAEELSADFGLSVDALDAAGVSGVAPKDGALLVVTAGSAGIYFGSGSSGVDRQAVSPVEVVVDRTGAGDAFDAGFLAAWVGGAGAADAVAAGHARSRQALGQVGASWRG